MRHPSGLQISDLEAIPSVIEQELTIEEAEKVVGGTGNSNERPDHPHHPHHPRHPIDVSVLLKTVKQT